jgi:catechol 2,3-dioxygenase-like lactoylglutathione lyase family enzyme
MADWYSRPVFFVADVDAASAFYIDTLGFTEAWRHGIADEPTLVAQVNREGCEIILSRQWPEKVGKGMLFISLTTDGWRTLPDLLAAKGVAVASGHWGYRVLILEDPDGNQLFFPDPEDAGNA